MIGFRFSEYVPGEESGSPFDRLLKLFTELMLHTGGDAGETLNWLNQLDNQYQIRQQLL